MTKGDERSTAKGVQNKSGHEMVKPSQRKDSSQNGEDHRKDQDRKACKNGKSRKDMRRKLTSRREKLRFRRNQKSSRRSDRHFDESEEESNYSHFECESSENTENEEIEERHKI